MKKIVFAGFFALFLLASLVACTGEDTITPPLTTQLTDGEEQSLLFMREEEKLARDVYLYLYDKYGLTIFNNISNAEQKHMDLVLTLLQKYGLEDVASPERGVFYNQDLQALYDALTAQGDVSVVEALKVGATIEDVDLFDLAGQDVSQQDILDAYDRLACGSRNHMRAFVGTLGDYGETYTPQYISQEDFDAILAGAHEHCGH